MKLKESQHAPDLYLAMIGISMLGRGKQPIFWKQLASFPLWLNKKTLLSFFLNYELKKLSLIIYYSYKILCFFNNIFRKKIWTKADSHKQLFWTYISIGLCCIHSSPIWFQIVMGRISFFMLLCEQKHRLFHDLQPKDEFNKKFEYISKWTECFRWPYLNKMPLNIYFLYHLECIIKIGN